MNKKYLTDSVSVNKKYLTDSGVPIEKKRVKGGGLLYGGLFINYQQNIFEYSILNTYSTIPHLPNIPSTHQIFLEKVIHSQCICE